MKLVILFYYFPVLGSQNSEAYVKLQIGHPCPTHYGKTHIGLCAVLFINQRIHLGTVIKQTNQPWPQVLWSSDWEENIKNLRWQWQIKVILKKQSRTERIIQLLRLLTIQCQKPSWLLLFQSDWKSNNESYNSQQGYYYHNDNYCFLERWGKKEYLTTVCQQMGRKFWANWMKSIITPKNRKCPFWDVCQVSILLQARLPFIQQFPLLWIFFLSLKVISTYHYRTNACNSMIYWNWQSICIINK